MSVNAEAQSIALEYDLPFPPAKVWRALTEPELLAKWLMVTDMRPLVGTTFTFKSDPTPWWWWHHGRFAPESRWLTPASHGLPGIAVS